MAVADNGFGTSCVSNFICLIPICLAIFHIKASGKDQKISLPLKNFIMYDLLLTAAQSRTYIPTQMDITLITNTSFAEPDLLSACAVGRHTYPHGFVED
jgi:hypothetical protein